MISRPASAGLLFVFCISDIPVRTFNRTFHQMNNASQSGCVVFCYCNAWNRTELRNAISPRARRSRETDSPPGHQTNNASQSGCVVFSSFHKQTPHKKAPQTRCFSLFFFADSFSIPAVTPYAIKNMAITMTVKRPSRPHTLGAIFISTSITDPPPSAVPLARYK